MILLLEPVLPEPARALLSQPLNGPLVAPRALASLIDLRRKSCTLQVVVVKSGDEVEPKPKAASTVAVSLFKNPEDLEPSNEVLGQDTFFG